MFNEVIGMEEVDKDLVKVFSREAIRAVILTDNNILLVKSNKGDYKFPGGGINKNENYEDALRREVTEETGYIVDNVIEKIGVVTERNPDSFEEGAVFEMTSHYYICTILDDKTEQQLDDYEAELDFMPIFIEIDKAIVENQKNLKGDDHNPWVYRETLVLQKLKESIIL